MTHDELLAKIDQIIAFEAPRPIKENIWEIGGYLSALALHAVVELHKPVEMMRGVGKENYSKKLFCSFESDDQRYPCPTIQAIEKELG